jgi:hypothetical protein
MSVSQSVDLNFILVIGLSVRIYPQLTNRPTDLLVTLIGDLDHVSSLTKLSQIPNIPLESLSRNLGPLSWYRSRQPLQLQNPKMRRCDPVHPWIEATLPSREVLRGEMAKLVPRMQAYVHHLARVSCRTRYVLLCSEATDLLQ